MTNELVVMAKAHSDDYKVEVGFMAQEWFEQASNADILALSLIEWGGDYDADEIAEFMEDKNEDVAGLFRYLHTQPVMSNGDSVGFECHVDKDSAMAWLAVHRPTTAERIRNGCRN